MLYPWSASNDPILNGGSKVSTNTPNCNLHIPQTSVYIFKSVPALLARYFPPATGTLEAGAENSAPNIPENITLICWRKKERPKFLSAKVVCNYAITITLICKTEPRHTQHWTRITAP